MKLEHCPARFTLNIIGGKWKPIIIYYLLNGVQRFGQLRKSIPDATQKMLTQQLRELEKDGIITRKVFHQVPPKVEYSLTSFGKTLTPVLKALCEWGGKHIKRKIN